MDVVYSINEKQKSVQPMIKKIKRDPYSIKLEMEELFALKILQQLPAVKKNQEDYRRLELLNALKIVLNIL